MSKNAQTSRRLAMDVLIVALLMLITVSSCILFATKNRYRQGSSIPLCAHKLGRLGIAIISYSLDNGDMFPAKSNWCDLLVNGYGITEEDFRCPEDSFTELASSYGFNKNLDGLRQDDVDPNTVLLFEITPGWNMSGGPELMIEDKHDGMWSAVLFADGHVETVPKEGKNKLKW